MDGRKVYLLASLNLTWIDHVMRLIKNEPEQAFTIACLHWQTPLFIDLLQPFKTQDIVVKVMESSFMEEVKNKLYDIWG